MKNLKFKTNIELSKLDEKALKEEMLSFSKKLYELKMKKELNELKENHLIRMVRRYIAILKTVARQKNFNIG